MKLHKYLAALIIFNSTILHAQDVAIDSSSEESENIQEETFPQELENFPEELEAQQGSLTGIIGFALLGKVNLVASSNVKEQVGEYLLTKELTPKFENIVIGPLTLTKATLAISLKGIVLKGEGTLFNRPVEVFAKSFIGVGGEKITPENFNQLFDIKNLQFKAVEDKQTTAFKETKATFDETIKTLDEEFQNGTITPEEYKEKVDNAEQTHIQELNELQAQPWKDTKNKFDTAMETLEENLKKKKISAEDYHKGIALAEATHMKEISLLQQNKPATKQKKSYQYAGNIGLQTIKLAIKFKKPLSIDIIKNVSLERMSITIDRSKPLKITTTLSLFNQSVNFIFKIGTDKKISLSAVTNNPILLKEIVPQLPGPLSNLALEHVAIEVNNIGTEIAQKKILAPEEIRISTTIAKTETIHPFEESTIPEVAKITFKNFNFVFDKTPETMEIALTGVVGIFNHELNGTIRILRAKQEQEEDVSKKTTKLGVILEVNASAYAHIGQLISSFNNTIFDQITLKNLRIIAVPQDIGSYEKGITIESTTQLSGALSPLAKLGNQPESVEVILSGHIAANLLKSSFKIELPFMIPIKGKDLSLGNMTVEIGGVPIPTLSVLTTLEFKVPRQNEPLKFIARISVNPTDALIAGSLIGIWHNACGLNGFDLSNVALQLGVNYAALASGLPISNFGLAATLGLGRRKLSLATNISIAHPEDFVLTGSLDKLSVQDFADLINQITKAHLDTHNIPDIAFEKLRFYMAPKDTKIGEFEFKQGFGGAAGISVIRFKAFVDFSYMNDEGIVFEGWASKFYLGELLVTGAGPDRIYGTADDGPYAKLELTKSAQRLFLSGLVVLDPVFKSETEIDFSGNELSFSFSTHLANAFDVVAVGKASLKNPEVYFLFDFKTDFVEYLQKEVDKALSEFQKKAEKDLTDAQKKVTELNKNIDDLSAQINERNNQIEQLKKVIAQKTEAAQKKVTDAKADLDNKKKELEQTRQKVQADIEARERAIDENKNRDINNLRNEVNSLQRQWDSFSDLEKTFRWVDVGIPLGAKKTGLAAAESKLGGAATQFGKGFLEKVGKGIVNDVGFKTAQAGVDAAQATLDAVKKVTFDPSSLKESGDIIRLGLEIGGLQTAKAGAIASRESATGILEGLKKVAYYGIGEGGKIIVKNLFGAVHIKHVRAEVSARELIKGNLPKLTLEMVIFGQERALKDMQFKFGDPKNPKEMPQAMAESAKSIGNAILKFITG